MPVYEYACATCEVIYEERRPPERVRETAPCPVCKRPGERWFSRVAVVRGGRDPLASAPARAAHGAARSHPAGCRCCGPRRPPVYA